jgi:chromatin remodeling complex protein RSC6
MSGAGPSDAELRTRIESILSTANLDELTVKKLMVQLSSEFATDLASKKAVVKALVDELLPRALAAKASSARAGDEGDEEAAQDDDDEHDDGESASAASKKAKKTKSAASPKFVSIELREVLGVDTTTFFGAVKLLWAYIKGNGLKGEGRLVHCDAKLKAVFGLDSIDSFTMAKYLTQHFLPAPNQSVGTIVHPVAKPKEPKAPKAKKVAAKRKIATPRVIDEETKSVVSRQMADVIGKERATFFELTKLIWVYIKEHDLHKNKLIHCDDKLKALFNNHDTIGSFTMAKYFKQHMLGRDAAGPVLVTVVEPPPTEPKVKKAKALTSGSAKSKAKRARKEEEYDDDDDDDDDDDGNVDDVVESELTESEADDDEDDDEDDE